MAWVVAARSNRPCATGRWSGCEFIVFSEEEENNGGDAKVFQYDDEIITRFPKATCAEFLWVYSEYTATGAGISRQLFSVLFDSEGDGIGGVGWEQTIAPGATDTAMVGAYLEQNGALAPDHERLPVGLTLLPGMRYDVSEVLGTAAAGDDLQVHIAFAVYS